MPVNLNSQVVEDVVIQPEIKETKVFDSVVVEEFTINDKNGSITIVYERYLNGEKLNERFQHIVVTGVAFGQVALGTPPPNTTRRDDLKVQVYNLLLQQLGLSGTIV